MSADCILTGCRSREDAVVQAIGHYGTDAERDAAGPYQGSILNGAYAIPLFWLAAFEASDGFLLDRLQPEEEGLPAQRYAVLCFWSPTTAAVQRLRHRRAMILTHVGEVLGGFYDQWIAFLERTFPDAILLQPEAISGLEGTPDGNRRLARAVESLDAAHAGQALLDADALHNVNAAEEPADTQRSGEPWTPKAYAEFRRYSLAGTDMDVWPPPPSEPEIEAAAIALAPSGAWSQARPWWMHWWGITRPAR